VAEFSTYYVCDVHGWDFTNVDEDVCPVCLGESLERERIIKLLKVNLDDDIKTDSMFHQNAGIQIAIALIKGENKCIHEIEVFGAPCLGGDFHEYCLKCGWVEPCEIDGENK
jgi:hypothetical protein